MPDGLNADHDYPRRRDGMLAAMPGTSLLALQQVHTGEERVVVLRNCPECEAEIMHDAGVWAECPVCGEVSFG